MDIATPLTAAVLARRKARQELHTPPLDSVNRRLFSVPSVMAQREAFIADREAIRDSFQGERAFPRVGEE